MVRTGGVGLFEGGGLAHHIQPGNANCGCRATNKYAKVKIEAPACGHLKLKVNEFPTKCQRPAEASCVPRQSEKSFNRCVMEYAVEHP